MIRNNDIRIMAQKAGVHLWEIAEVLGYSDCTFSRKLRKKLLPTEKQKIIDIISAIKSETIKGDLSDEI